MANQDQELKIILALPCTSLPQFLKIIQSKTRTALDKQVT